MRIAPPANPGPGGDDPDAGGSGDDGGWSTDAQIGLVVGGLVAVAAAVAAITFFYWRRTRPQQYLTALDALAEIDRGHEGPHPATGAVATNGLKHTPPHGTSTADILGGGSIDPTATPQRPTAIVGPAPLTPHPPVPPPVAARAVGSADATPEQPAAPTPLVLPPVDAEPSRPAAPAPKLKLPEPGEVRPLLAPPTPPLVTLEDLEQRGGPPDRHT